MKWKIKSKDVDYLGKALKKKNVIYYIFKFVSIKNSPALV